MDISAYIRDLISMNDCVILRDFGGFDTQYKKAEIDRIKNKITPPSKKITFRQDWSKDNGALEEYLMEQLSVSKENAAKEIKDFVDKLHKDLDEKGFVELHSIGKFKKSGDQITFEEFENELYLADSYGFGPLEDVKPKTSLSSSSSSPTPTPTTFSSTKPTTQRPSQWSEKTRVKSEERFHKKPQPAKPKPEKVQFTPQKKKRKGLYIFIGVLFFIVLLGSVLIIAEQYGKPIIKISELFNSTSDEEKVVFGNSDADNNMNTESVDDDPTIKKIEASIDDQTHPKNALAPDLNDVNENKDEKGNNDTEINAQEPKYFIVAGSFQEKKNAQAMISRLSEQGFSTKIKYNQRTGYYRVIIAEFADKQKALYELEKVRNKVNQSFWLLQKK